MLVLDKQVAANTLTLFRGYFNRLGTCWETFQTFWEQWFVNGNPENIFSAGLIRQAGISANYYVDILKYNQATLIDCMELPEQLFRLSMSIVIQRWCISQTSNADSQSIHIHSVIELYSTRTTLDVPWAVIHDSQMLITISLDARLLFKVQCKDSLLSTQVRDRRFNHRYCTLRSVQYLWSNHETRRLYNYNYWVLAIEIESKCTT